MRAFLVVLAVSLPQLAQAQAPVATQRVNTGGDNSHPGNQADGASMVSSNGTFRAVWAEQNGTDSTHKDIWCARKVTTSAAWTIPVRVDLGDGANQTDSEFPKLAVGAATSTLHCVWEDNRDGAASGSANEDLYYNRSTNGGVSWQATSIALNTLTDGSHVSTDIDDAAIAASGGAVHVVWSEELPGNPNGYRAVWYVRSIDEGQSWSTPTQLLYDTAFDSHGAQVVAVGSHVVVAAYERLVSSNTEDVYVFHSYNWGESFEPKKYMSHPAPVVGGGFDEFDDLQLAMSGQLVYFVATFTVGTHRYPYVWRSLDWGFTWQGALPVCGNMVQAADTYGTSIALDGNRVLIAYASDGEDLTAGGTGGASHAKAYVTSSFYAWSSFWNPSFDIEVDAVGGRPNSDPIVVADDCGAWTFFQTGAPGSEEAAWSYHSSNLGAFWSTYDVPAQSSDCDFENLAESRPVAVDRDNHVALGLMWDRPAGHNELYSSGMSGCAPPVTYCTPGISTLGCSADMLGAGTPSISQSSGFTLKAVLVDGQKSGQFFYGISGRIAVPFAGSNSYRCVHPPTQRMTLTTSTGTGGQCNGLFFEDWLTYLSTHPSCLGTPFMAGQVVDAQLWYRDSGVPAGIQMSNGLEFVVEP